MDLSLQAEAYPSERTITGRRAKTVNYSANLGAEVLFFPSPDRPKDHRS